MKLTVELINNSNARIISNNRVIVNEVGALLSCEDPKAKYTSAYKSGFWDGKIKFMSPNGVFPIGFFPKVVSYLKNNYDYSIVDNRVSKLIPKLYPKTVGDIRLRRYQLDIVRDVFSNEVNGVSFPRGIIDAATNAGKSLVAAAIFKSLKIPCLYLCHRVEILDQVVCWFKEYFDEPIGVYNSKLCNPERITVAMITTMYSRRESDEVRSLMKYGCLIVDEAHHASSNTWSWVIGKSMAYFKLGLSGTAMDSEHHRNMKLIGLLGPVIHSVSNIDLVEGGYSAIPKITILRYTAPLLMSDEVIKQYSEELKGLQSVLRGYANSGNSMYGVESRVRKLRMKLYSRIYELGVCKSTNRAIKLLNVCKRHSNSSILIVVKHIGHGEFLKEYLRCNDIDCVFISGGADSDVRQRIYRSMVSGKIKVLIATMIYKEGVDIPSIDVLILAMGEKAPITILQTFGRALRKRPDKESVFIYDFYDNGHRILAGHSLKRIDIYRKEKFKPCYE